MDAEVTGLLPGGPRQAEVTARRVVQPVGLVPYVVDVHGQLLEEVQDAGGAARVFPSGL
ncbi:hypothetical protein [Streptomyces chilikensis]|uniref:hypothetical protein n=1 Tax=Streptomyces chilikensis TaxID=1194079 RepID=UPI0019D091E6|nr:hypothetical protein [Streptomyces chilikensis]